MFAAETETAKPENAGRVRADTFAYPLICGTVAPRITHLLSHSSHSCVVHINSDTTPPPLYRSPPLPFLSPHPAMDDRETELSRFRQQWKAEVTARQTRPAVPPQLSSSSETKPAFPSRKLSHSSAAAKEVPEEWTEAQAAASLPEPGARERPTSPTAARRTSVSVPSVLVVPESALEHYEKAVEKEAQGSLGESLSLYRKAFRVRPDGLGLLLGDLLPQLCLEGEGLYIPDGPKGRHSVPGEILSTPARRPLIRP